MVQAQDVEACAIVTAELVLHGLVWDTLVLLAGLRQVDLTARWIAEGLAKTVSEQF
jgi:hypothetical protein